MSKNDSFGVLLRRFRKRGKCTQKELAERCTARDLEISFSMISHLERDKRKPGSRDKVVTIADALDLSPSERADLLASGGFEADMQQIAAEDLWSQFPRLGARVADKQNLELLLDPLAMPDLAVIDGSLSKLLDAWIEHSKLRALLRQRKWHEVLEQAEAVEESVDLISAQLHAYLKDIRSLAYQHSGRMLMAERTVLQAKHNAERNPDDSISGIIAVHRADILRNSALIKEAEHEYECAMKCFEAKHDHRRAAWCKRKLAALRLFSGKWQEVEPMLQECLETFRGLNDQYELAHTHNSLGWAFSMAGKWDLALQEREVAIRLAEAQNTAQGYVDEYTLARCHLYIGDDLRQLARLEEAEQHMLKALELSERLQEQYERGRIYLCLSKVYRLKGYEFHTEALRFARQSLRFHQEQGMGMRLAQSINQLGLCYQDLGEYGIAEEYFREAIGICNREGAQIPYYEAIAQINLVRLMCIMGEFGDEFDKHCERANEICIDKQYNFKRHLAQLNAIMAEYCVVTKKPRQAADHAEKAYEFAYSFNRYLADDIHGQVMTLVRSKIATVSVKGARTSIRLLLEKLRLALDGDNGWGRTLEESLRKQLRTQLRELEQATTELRNNPAR